MWSNFNSLVEREWARRLQQAGLAVPAGEVPGSFRGVFGAAMVSTFMGLIGRCGVEKAARIIEEIMPSCIEEMQLDEDFLRWILATPGETRDN